MFMTTGFHHFRSSTLEVTSSPIYRATLCQRVDTSKDLGDLSFVARAQRDMPRYKWLPVTRRPGWQPWPL